MAYVMVPFRSAFSVILLVLFAAACPARAASPDTAADAQAGAVLFRDKGCAHCHGDGGAGTLKAPSLVDIRKDKDWPPEKMTDHILNGGQKMPPFRESLNDDEIAQLVAYLRAKNKPTPPPLANGQAAPPDPGPKN
jgi:mono/diheme cytochrome c family protein